MSEPRDKTLCPRCGAAFSLQARACLFCGSRRDVPRLGAGSLAGRFLLKRGLWEDALGAVFAIEDVQRGGAGLARLIPSGLTRAADLSARAKQEGPRWLSLSLPGLPPLRHVGPLDTGEILLVWSVSPGRSLADEVREKGPLRPESLAAWMDASLSGLEGLHAAGFSHGGLCLASFSEGAAGLLDAGSAVIASLPGGPPAPEQVAGPWPYLAPERWRGAPPSPAADVYGLGALVWHALTGRPPLEAKDAAGFMGLHSFERPTRASSLPEPLADLLRQALAKRPEDRPASAGVFWRRFLSEVPRPVPVVVPIAAPLAVAPSEVPPLPVEDEPTPRPEGSAAVTRAARVVEPKSFSLTQVVARTKPRRERRAPWAWALAVVLLAVLAVACYGLLR